jgi:hypothetical protein
MMFLFITLAVNYAMHCRRRRWIGPCDAEKLMHRMMAIFERDLRRFRRSPG